MDKEIDTIKNMKENGAFKKYIEYIVFPYYKNLVPGTKINLEFPITILVGKNGSGKSSTLHEVYGNLRVLIQYLYGFPAFLKVKNTVLPTICLPFLQMVGNFTLWQPQKVLQLHPAFSPYCRHNVPL